MTDRSEAWAWAVDGRMRNTDGQPIVEYQGGAHVDGGCWVQLVDVWPEGNLQAQLDRIEARVGRTNARERWGSFTGAELAILMEALGSVAFGCERPEDQLRDDVEAEITRRAT